MPTASRLLSIITVTYNAGEKTAATLESVIHQDQSLFDYHIVDGGSSDQTLEVIRRSAPDADVVSEPDAGVYDAINKGIARSRGRFLYFLGAGDTLRPGILARVAERIANSPPNSIVYGNVHWVSRQRLYDGIFSKSDLTTHCICHQAMFIDRSVFELLGMYDRRYPISADWHFNIRCFSDPRVHVEYTIAYAFGTNTWVTSSQAMWQHGLSELLLAIVLYAAPRSEQRARWAAVAGTCCALMAANRPADGLMALAVGAWFLRPAIWRPFLTAAAPVAIATAAFNVGVYGKLSGGYGYLLSDAFPAQHATLEGVVGLLVSPAKGLMVFSPFFIILLAASPRRFREAGQKRLAILIMLGVALELLLYGRSVWNSYSFGPRYLSGSLPAMIWLIAPVVDAMKRPLRLALIGTIAFAIGVQAVGAFYYPSSGTEILYRREPWTLWHPPFNTVIRDFQAGPIVPGVIGRRPGGEPASGPK